MKRALIIGCMGQDGTYLYENLAKRQYEIIGIGKKVVKANLRESIDPVDITQRKQVYEFLNKYRPQEIYYLAAYHHSSEDEMGDEAQVFNHSYEIHVLSFINFLEAMKKYLKNSRLFYAASSHIFGEPKENIQTEATPLNPTCIYGITKAAGVHTCRFYRENYKLYVSVGILYNHESSRRSPKFVSQKIVNTAIAIKNRSQDKLVVGNLNAKIDWGYAPDYVEAMIKILQLPEAGDFIIASGATHTVRDFVKGVFDYLNLDWTRYVKEDARLITKKAKDNLQGDPQKLKTLTGWQPGVSFEEMIKIMVKEAACG